MNKSRTGEAIGDLLLLRFVVITAAALLVAFFKGSKFTRTISFLSMYENMKHRLFSSLTIPIIPKTF